MTAIVEPPTISQREHAHLWCDLPPGLPAPSRQSLGNACEELLDDQGAKFALLLHPQGGNGTTPPPTPTFLPDGAEYSRPPVSVPFWSRGLRLMRPEEAQLRWDQP
jgi:hypothetical protein